MGRNQRTPETAGPAALPAARIPKQPAWPLECRDPSELGTAISLRGAAFLRGEAFTGAQH